MIFENAIKGMNRDDIFRCKNGDEMIMCDDKTPRFRNSNIPVFMNVENMNLEGEIIRAEPEVLTAEEWIDRNHPDTVFSTGYIKRTYKEGTENGRVKEWKRLKPLIDSVVVVAKRLKNYTMTDSEFDEWLAIKEAFKNLTPPWKAEK